MSYRDPITTLLQRSSSQPALTLMHGREQRLQWTYAELQSQRLYCQLMLLSSDVEAGDRVVIITHNLPHFFALLLATMTLDACLLPLHPDFAKNQVLDLITRQRPRVIIVDDTLLLPTWLAHSAPTLFRLRARDQHWLREVLDTPLQAARAPLCQQGRPPTEQPLLLFHSSGTTGQPKAMYYTRVMLNRFLHLQSHLYAAFPDAAPADTATLSDRVNVLPVTHWGGLCFCLQALLEGRTLHLLRSDDPAAQLQLLRDTGCQLLMLVPAVITQLLSSGNAAADLPALRYCLTMGEAVSAPQLDQLSQRLGIRIHVAYGMSECLSGFAHVHEDLAGTPTGSCGRLVFGEAKLVDADGQEQEEFGELWVRNDTTVPCYADPQLVQQKYTDGWYHTGDIFRRNQQGYYFFHGRRDAMCVVNGRNVFPAEVEAVLLQHPVVAECVVTPVYIKDDRQRLAAMIVVAAGYRLQVTELLDFYMRHGAVFATPVWVQFCSSLPRNAGGKYDRQACAAALQAGYQQRQAAQAPLDPLARGAAAVS